MKRILTTASAAFLALGTAASAATFTVNGGTFGEIPGTGALNEVLINTFSLGGAEGYFGANIALDEAADIEVAAFGFEAGFTNTFTLGGTSIDTDTLDPLGNGGANEAYAPNGGTPLWTATELGVAAGVLNFSFLTDGNVPNPLVTNGSNPDNTSNNPNFFVSLGQDGTSQTLFLFFDDGGAGNDDNHDDLVIRLSVGAGNTTPTPVPLPATGLLLLGALGGMRMMKRRS